MKFFYTALLLILSISYSSAQRQGYRWYFGSHAGLNFNSGPVATIKNGQINTNEGCSTISDKQTGSLLFYTDGVNVWDKTNNFMPSSLTGLGGSLTSSQSALIVPKPGSSILYYIFTVDAQGGFLGTGDSGLNCSIVNMTLHGGLGDVTTLDSLMLKPATEKLCATLACNDTDIWMMVHQWNSNAFYAYLITKKGISAPVISNTGIVHENVGSADNSEAEGYMKFSPDGHKVALACNNDINKVQIFDFNNVTGVVSNPVTDSNYSLLGGIGPYGVCFSPDNSKLYITYTGSNTINSFIYQYNMQAGSGAAIVASRTQIFSSVDALGAIQSAPDGRIYVAKDARDSLMSDSIDIITNPNALGTACNYVPNAMTLGGLNTNQSEIGLPEMVEQFYLQPYIATLSYPGCSGNNTSLFIDSTIHGDINSYWNFGDVASGTADTSTSQNPTHTFSKPGIYTVKLILSTPCVIDTIIKIDTINPTAQLIINPASTSLCSGESLSIKASGFTNYTWSPNQGLSATTGDSVIANPTVNVTYTITGADTSGCTAQVFDTITIIPAPNVPTITQEGDTLISSAHTNNQWYLNDTLLKGDTSRYLIITKNGVYSVVVTNPANGCSSNSNKITGINQLSINNYQLCIFPNPTNGIINININSSVTDINDWSLRLTDVLGCTLYMRNTLNYTNEIDLANYPAGVYFVDVTNFKSHGIFPFIKQ